MSRARKELERLNGLAWRRFAGDLRRAGRSTGRLGSACFKKHPVLVLGGGALLAALAASRPAPRVVERKAPGRITSTLWRMGRAWLTGALTSALAPSGRRKGSGAGSSSGEPR